jgi:hypothetical protein
LGSEEPIPDGNLDHYQRDSEPIIKEEIGVIPIEDLIKTLEETQATLSNILLEMTEEDLQQLKPYRNNPERPLAAWIFFLYFHDCYHVGQTELLRQAAGTDDKII